MENAQPPLLPHPATPGSPAPSPALRRRNTVTFKLLFIAGLVLLLQLPLTLINELRQERSKNRQDANARIAERQASAIAADRTPNPSSDSGRAYNPAVAAAEGYRMVERSLKHSMLVLTLTFTAFFLFETLAGLRLHAVHYGLVGAALCLFYLALLALGEVLEPGWAYVGAAVASSLLITPLLVAEHSVLYVVLRMEDYALLAGTASLFVALAGLMYFTRNVDWFAQETGKEAHT